ncbi:MAG: DEAD/DEAH box helicase [Anaerolineae bacterium]|nr:DEAD/DEAH box helicase [Anaerolineae bacterium]
MSVESALQALRCEPRFMRHVVRWEHVPSRPPRYADFPAALDRRLIEALTATGVRQLYTHQAAAVAAALRGEHVAVVTPAASGKTLCYNLPVLHRLLADETSRALYLYPTKALAQDQLAALRHIVTQAGGLRYTATQTGGLRDAADLTCATYDGDTPSAQRGKVRATARIILSNPDMLHAGILPQHPRWAAFFAQLTAVVIDEMHVYRGVFGSHVANVLRRLRRICRFYGSDPRFYLASATIANPQELAERLVEAPVTVIGPEQDGAPQGERAILFYNPPLLDPALGLRRSAGQEAADLAAHFLAHDVQLILFGRTRLAAELILTYLRQTLAAQPMPITDRLPSSFDVQRAIRGYRSGYLPAERRAIEAGLRDGAVRAVVATSALELGIDIGQMAAALLAGYPGTIAAARQQMGRAGRRQGTAAAVLVAAADPLDQYLMTHTEYLLERSPEHARLNPDNAVILAGHLACAAAELPFARGEGFGAAGDATAQERVAHLLDELVEAGRLYRTADRYFWAGTGTPATTISLRSSSAERVLIQTTDPAGQPRLIGEIERVAAPLFVYEGAIYLHEGASYQVERLDWPAGVATVRPIAADFYTRPIANEHVAVLTTRATFQYGPSSVDPAARAEPRDPSFVWRCSWGAVRVVRQVTGYRIIRRGTNEVLGFGQLDLPEQAFETEGCWLELSSGLIEQLRQEGRWLSDPNDYGPNWPRQRDAARARDGFRCQGCGALETGGRQHDVHHRIPLRAFVADPGLRGDLPPERAWEAANALENLVTLCPACHRRAETSVRMRSGLGGAAALLLGVAPIFLMCDPADLGMVVEPQAATSGLPTITVFEQMAGGVGYAEQLYRLLPQALAAALDLVRNCACEYGCPSCVGPVLEHEYMLDAKTLARALLEKIVLVSADQS